MGPFEYDSRNILGPFCGTPSFDLEFDLEGDLEILIRGHIHDQHVKLVM